MKREIRRNSADFLLSKIVPAAAGEAHVLQQGDDGLDAVKAFRVVQGNVGKNLLDVSQSPAGGVRGQAAVEILFVLVAIPLPGTGAWTGALVASLLDIRLRNALPAILLGLLAAGAITTAVTLGVIRLF